MRRRGLKDQLIKLWQHYLLYQISFVYFFFYIYIEFSTRTFILFFIYVYLGLTLSVEASKTTDIINIGEENPPFNNTAYWTTYCISSLFDFLFINNYCSSLYLHTLLWYFILLLQSAKCKHAIFGNGCS